jgi:hypothetical protein
VTPEVAGSSPVSHPKRKPRPTAVFFPRATDDRRRFVDHHSFFGRDRVGRGASSRTRTALAISFAACLAACGGGGSGGGTPAAAPSLAPPATPIVAGLATPGAGSVYFGAFVDPSGLTHGNSLDAIDALETQIGRTLAVDNQYLVFNSKFGTRNELDDYQHGRLPMYSWDCGPSNAQIASGAYDASIRGQADAIKAYGWPVLVRYMYDPDLPPNILQRARCYDPLTDNADGTFSASEFVAAWQHIRTIFEVEGAVNAVFLWSVGGSGTHSLAYYPGDAETDWVGMDAYDVADTTFSATIAPAYALLAPYGKPIAISETGADGLTQPQFFASVASTLQSQFPLVRAFVYYDAIGTQNDWRITASGQAAFDTLAGVHYMSGYYNR